MSQAYGADASAAVTDRSTRLGQQLSRAIVRSRSAGRRGWRSAILTLTVGPFQVAGGQTATVTLHLSAKARTLLARTHLLLSRATIVARDPAGATHTALRTVTIRPATTTRRKG